MLLTFIYINFYLFTINFDRYSHQPIVLPNVGAQTVSEKGNVELIVKVAGLPEPTVKWFQDGREVVLTLKFKTSKTGDVHTLSVQQVTQAQTGQYKCVATNIHGTVEHTSTVTVTGLCSSFSLRSRRCSF